MRQSYCCSWVHWHTLAHVIESNIHSSIGIRGGCIRVVANKFKKTKNRREKYRNKGWNDKQMNAESSSSWYRFCCGLFPQHNLWCHCLRWRWDLSVLMFRPVAAFVIACFPSNQPRNMSHGIQELICEQRLIIISPPLEYPSNISCLWSLARNTHYNNWLSASLSFLVSTA